ncbi:hypothetical protein CEXT_566901 [Caerostris extrusa]|uniref:Uncharacterized protein n=1 Tax=Caerostris extrusa TaxID=172846 RepID=A0AAV4R7Z8_CAEEX|nr:hypothetical protein CEXT_566901 [Caerostris extrusa]
MYHEVHLSPSWRWEFGGRSGAWRPTSSLETSPRTIYELTLGIKCLSIAASIYHFIHHSTFVFTCNTSETYPSKEPPFFYKRTTDLCNEVINRSLN